jgi:hypothetical protein
MAASHLGRKAGESFSMASILFEKGVKTQPARQLNTKPEVCHLPV